MPRAAGDLGRGLFNGVLGQCDACPLDEFCGMNGLWAPCDMCLAWSVRFAGHFGSNTCDFQPDPWSTVAWATLGDRYKANMADKRSYMPTDVGGLRAPPKWISAGLGPHPPSQVLSVLRPA